MVSVDAVPVRLIPRWFTAVTLLLLGLFTVLFLLLAVLASGPMRPAVWALVVMVGSLLVAALSALARPRRRRELPVLADGTRVLRAPVTTGLALLVALAAAYVAAGWIAWLAVTDLDALEAPGASLVAVLGAVGMLPDVVRLLTGRLHRWTLEVGPETVRYRGYRTDVTYPRREVRGATVQRRGPAGVRIDVRGGGGPVVPAAAFDVPAEQVLEELRRR